MRRTRRPRFVLMNKMDDLNLHYRFLNWRRRIREIREVRAFRYQERFKHILVDGDTLSYHGNSGEVGCYVASRPLTKDSNYFEVSIVDSGVRGTIAVGLVPQYYSLDHQPGWLPDSVAYHADDGKLYNGRAKGRQFGSKCNSGDRIGCGIEPVSFDVQTAQIFFTKNGKRVGSTIMPMSPDGLFPAVGMHSLGEEVRLHLNAELGREDDSVMMVDSYEDEWGRLHDVRVCGTLLEYLGKGKSIVDVGLAQARHPLSTRSHYFEVEIVDPGEKCYIALGLARKVGDSCWLFTWRAAQLWGCWSGARKLLGKSKSRGAGRGGRVFTRDRAQLFVFAVGGYGPLVTHDRIEDPDCSTQVGWGQPAALAVKAKHPCHLPCVPCNLKCLKGVGGYRGVSSCLGS